MNFTARDALKFARPFIWQYWSIYAFWTDSFLFILNTCIEMIYAENWYIWTWQHTKESYTNLVSDGDWAVTLLTKYPIKTIDRFYTWKMTPLQWVATACDCPVPEPDPCNYTWAWDCWCCCRSSACCCTDGQELDISQILPQNKLWCWDYQISTWDLPGMWGLSWRAIKFKPNGNISGLRVTYYRWPNSIKTFDDIVPLPQSRVATVLPLLISTFVNIDRSGFFYQLYAKKIEDLKKEDNVFPKKVQFDPNYPFFWNSQANIYPM